MKKLMFIVLLFPSICFANGPKYTYPEVPGLDDEMNNIYHDLKYPNILNGTASTFTITNLTFTAGTVPKLGIGLSNTEAAFLQIGDTTTLNSVDPAVSLSRNINDASGTGDAHGYSDSSVYSRTVATPNVIAYAAWDGETTMASSVPMDHIVSFQAHPFINTSKYIGKVVGSVAYGSLIAGNITNVYDFEAHDFSVVSGSITAQYGVFVDTLTAGATNYGIFVSGNNPSYFGGTISTPVGMNFKVSGGTPGPILYDSGASNSAAITAPSSISSSYVLRMPTSSTRGSLNNDGSGNLSFGGAPTIQKFTSGAGTYTLPSNPTPLYIQVIMVGGGGGGSGSGSASSSSNGGTGGTSSFGTSLSSATGGVGGTWNGNGGTGGVANLGTGPIGTALTGGTGQGYGYTGGGGPTSAGGCGAGTPFGGAGGGGTAGVAGYAGATNTGSGGGGGGTTTAAGIVSGTGGGAGAYVNEIISNPSATYSYGVGSAGTAGGAGTGGFAGGAGGSGYIEVREFYQ